MQDKGSRAVTPFILPSHRGHTPATTRHTCVEFDSTTIADFPSIQSHHTSHPPLHPTIEIERVPSTPPLPTSLTPIAGHLQRKNRHVRVPNQEIICTKLHWQNHSNPQAHSTHRLLPFQRNLHMFSHRSARPKNTRTGAVLLFQSLFNGLDAEDSPSSLRRALVPCCLSLAALAGVVCVKDFQFPGPAMAMATVLFQSWFCLFLRLQSGSVEEEWCL